MTILITITIRAYSVTILIIRLLGQSFQRMNKQPLFGGELPPY